MEIAARDATIAKAMIVGAKDPKMKNELWTERSQMDRQRSVLMAELKPPSGCASACDTTLSQRESPSPCGAFGH